EGGLEFQDAGQQAVDETGRAVGGQVAGQGDGIADGDRVGHVVLPEQLERADAQDVAVHGGHALQGPALGVAAQQLVDLVPVDLDAADQFGRVGGHGRAGG